MNKTQLLERIETLGPLECMCRDYLVKHGHPMSIDQARAQLQNPSLPQTQKGKIRITPENTYINQNHDIAVTKHPSYFPCEIHAHDFFEVVYVYRGTFNQRLDDRDMCLKAGDLCILSPRLPHQPKVFDESIAINLLIRKSTFHNAFFGLLREKDVFADFFSRVLYTEKDANHLLVHTNEDDKIRDLVIDIMLEYLNQESYCRQLLRLDVSKLFALCLR